MYDYSELRGRAVTKLGSTGALAKVLGISKNSLSKKFTGKTQWSVEDIEKTISVLDIPREKITFYFFTKKF